MRKTFFVAVLFAAIQCGPIPQWLKAQVITDSIVRKVDQFHKANTKAQYNALLVEMQSLCFSDSMAYLLHRMAGDIRKRHGDTSLQYGNALASLGMSSMWKGDYQNSVRLFQEAMGVLRPKEKRDAIALSVALNSLGKLYAKFGDYEKAFAYCKEAKALREKHSKGNDFRWNTLYPISLDDLAGLYMDKLLFDSAFVLYQESLRRRFVLYGEGHPYYILGLNNLGRFYATKGEYGKALSHQLKTVDTLRRIFGTGDTEYNIALGHLAALYQKMGRMKEAAFHLHQNIEWQKKFYGENHTVFAQSLLNAGLLSQIPGDAAQSFFKANKIQIAHLRNTYAALSEQEKIAYLNQEAGQFDYLPSLLLLNKGRAAGEQNQLYENELALKGMVLEDQQQILRTIRQSADSSALPVYNRWRYNKALHGQLSLSPNLRKVVNTDSIAELTNRLEQQLSMASAGFRKLQQIQSITANGISQKLLKNEAAIEFMRFRVYNKKWTNQFMYAAAVRLPNDTATRFIPLFEEKALLKILRTPSGKSAGIHSLYPSDASATASALYNLIWKPLAKTVQGVHIVHYAPAGLLHRISFNALRKNAKHLLIDFVRLNQLLSTRSVALAGEALAAKPQTAAVWGGIGYDAQKQTNGVNGLVASRGVDTSFNLYNSDTRGGIRTHQWPSLPGTKKERENIQKLFSEAGIVVNTAGDGDATEEAFKALDGNSPQLIHLATHGFFLPVAEAKPKDNIEWQAGRNPFTVQQNPMFRSGLVLAGGNHVWVGKPALPGREDGILTAYEISQLDLSKTDLVVLSACETALGDLQGTEGVLGLQRAFKLAGVKQMILSLWRVQDKETTELMTLFYKAWLSGQPVRQALRTAQLTMRKKYPPFYWAGFVVVE